MKSCFVDLVAALGFVTFVTMASAAELPRPESPGGERIENAMAHSVIDIATDGKAIHSVLRSHFAPDTSSLYEGSCTLWRHADGKWSVIHRSQSEENKSSRLLFMVVSGGHLYIKVLPPEARAGSRTERFEAL